MNDDFEKNSISYLRELNLLYKQTARKNLTLCLKELNLLHQWQSHL